MIDVVAPTTEGAGDCIGRLDHHAVGDIGGEGGCAAFKNVLSLSYHQLVEGSADLRTAREKDAVSPHLGQRETIAIEFARAIPDVPALGTAKRRITGQGDGSLDGVLLAQGAGIHNRSDATDPGATDGEGFGSQIEGVDHWGCHRGAKKIEHPAGFNDRAGCIGAEGRVALSDHGRPALDRSDARVSTRDVGRGDRKTDHTEDASARSARVVEIECSRDRIVNNHFPRLVVGPCLIAGQHNWHAYICSGTANGHDTRPGFGDAVGAERQGTVGSVAKQSDRPGAI